MWDSYYGPMSPGEILGNLESLAEKAVETDVPIPPEFERELTALRKLKKRVLQIGVCHDTGRAWSA